MDWSSAGALGAFLLAAFAAASSGSIFRPDAWYDGLRKPSWTPRPWVFPVVWTPLYLLMAVSGWLVWREVGLFIVPFIPYLVQLVLNAAWSAIFFGLRRPDLACIEVIALWLSIAATIVAFAPISAVAAWLLAPYLLWVSIASVLNATVWRLNADRFARV